MVFFFDEKGELNDESGLIKCKDGYREAPAS